MKMRSNKPDFAIVLSSKKMEASNSSQKQRYGEMAEELLDAIKSNDAEEFAMALKSFINICRMDYNKEEDE